MRRQSPKACHRPAGSHTYPQDLADHAFDPRIGRSGFRGDRTGTPYALLERHTGDAAAVSKACHGPAGSHTYPQDHADHAFDPRIGRSGFRGDMTGHAYALLNGTPVMRRQSHKACHGPASSHTYPQDLADHAFDPRIGRSGLRGDMTGHAICATERHTGDAAAVSRSLPWACRLAYVPTRSC